MHTWLPDAHTQAPTPGSVILAGVLLKLGVYGMIRFAFPLFPLAAGEGADILAWLAVAGIVYGALVAWAQTDAKRLVAYSSVSHMGFIVLGIVGLLDAGADRGDVPMPRARADHRRALSCVSVWSMSGGTPG